MEIRELRQLLQQPYSTSNWRELLGYVFENVQFNNPPVVIPTDDERVKELKQYGIVQLSDGKNLALFELKVNEDKVKLLSNRVGLNELVKKYIDQDSYHGILSIFDQDQEDYRFTFTAKNTEFDEEQGFIDKDTDTKRFTYILGKNQSCRTAAERFDALRNSENQNIKSVEEAFNVEKLSKKFFTEYIDQFKNLVDYLQSNPTFYQAIFENEESDARNFVKQFMGRLVFLKFIQKKGWLGVPITEQAWKNGDFNFLENQYRDFEHKDNFLSTFLNPLFFEALDKGNRENNEFQNRGYKIPHLSGGLFENDHPKTNRVNFPQAYLDKLFDFFERYNFTIDENDVHDKEVGIDPEMLGHIFENLLEDNKDKGAFYTPKEIVRYMCQESLKEYLKTYLEKKDLWPKKDVDIKEFEETLAAFVEKKDTAKIAKFDKELATALKEVKICDPAIGSGAFPMGLLNEIFTMTRNLYEESPDRVGAVWGMSAKTWEPHTVKQNIIQNSIYGVDIEPGAVDIARLRFWLSLVIEEETPRPLPHLDYKIVVGNSLISKLEDTIIDIDWDLKPQVVQADIFGNEGKTTEKRNLIREITDLQKQVFEPNSDEETLSIKIRDKKIDLLVLQLEIMIAEKGVTEKPQGTARNIKEMTEKWLETKGWKDQIKKLQKMKGSDKTPLEFFDWLLDFPEVMNPEVNVNPGFDIVIGNPPYYQLRQLDKKLQKQYKESKIYKYAQGGRLNIFQFFIPFAINICKELGIICLITQNSILSENTAKSNRKFIFAKTTPKSFDSFPERDNSKTRVFETVKMSVAISLLKKQNNINNHSFPIKIWRDRFMSKSTTLRISLKEIKDLFGEELIIPLASNHSIQILKKIKNHKNSKYLNSQAGEIDMSKYKNDFILKKENSIRVYTGAQILRYSTTNSPSQGNVLYLPKRHLPNTKKASARFKERIVMQRITGVDSKLRLIMSIIDKNSLCANSTNFISGYKPDELRNILGILNSKLINYFFKLTSTNTNITTTEINSIPICKFNSDTIAIYVKSIFELKELKSQTMDIENKIDNLIYKMYNLTYEEALIIEPELNERLTEAEYDAIEI